MKSCYLLSIIAVLFVISAQSFNITEHEEKLKQHRRHLEESTAKIEQRTRDYLSKHEQQAREARNKMDKTSNDAMEKARARLTEMRARRDAQFQKVAGEKIEETESSTTKDEPPQKVEGSISKEDESTKTHVVPPTTDHRHDDLKKSSPAAKKADTLGNDHEHRHDDLKKSSSAAKKADTLGNDHEHRHDVLKKSSPAAKKADTLGNTELKHDAPPASTASSATLHTTTHSNVLDDKLNEVRNKQQRHGANLDKSKNALEVHSVDDNLVAEINRMAASFTPRDAILNHISTHFPDKKTEDWNDIMIASLAKNRRKIPGHDTDRASRRADRSRQASPETQKEKSDL